jgi:putative colanic acid biosynthesis acetyltransferase WcaB
MADADGGIFQDWAHQSSFKSRVVLALFRSAQRAARWPAWLAPARGAVIGFYRLLTEWLLGIDLPWQVRVGPRLRLHHGHALVVHEASVLGADCTLRHSTTLGTTDPSGVASRDAPVLGDGVDVGCHVAILGPVRVGDRAAIGAGSVVVGDVPPDAVVVGNPARVVGTNEHPVIPRRPEAAALPD